MESPQLQSHPTVEVRPLTSGGAYWNLSLGAIVYRYLNPILQIVQAGALRVAGAFGIRF